MAAEGGAIITFIFTGANGEVIPQNATHIVMHESVTIIPEEAFKEHPNIIEVYCHIGVKRIKKFAFYECPRLRRVVMLGVEVVEERAFKDCKILTHVECDKLEIIQEAAFIFCVSLVSINLLSVKIIESYAFGYCTAMTEAIFSANLESVHTEVFIECHNLKRVVIPLKKNLIVHECQVFAGCRKMMRVDLVEDEVLRNTIDALNLEEWRDDLIKEIDSINLVLPHTICGGYVGDDNGMGDDVVGMKSMEIENWTIDLFKKIIRYKAQHRLLLEEAAAALQLASSNDNDIVMNAVLPFLQLPSHTFEGEEEELGVN